MAETNAAPFDRTHRLHPLILGIFVVNEGQEDFVIETLHSNEVYACFMTRGKGTSQSLFSEVTGVGLLRKIVLFAVMREDIWKVVRKPIEDRFNVSRISHGIAFSMPLSTVMSVSNYKMLANIRIFEAPLNKGRKKKLSNKIIGGNKK